jgi:hypothetical protein
MAKKKADAPVAFESTVVLDASTTDLRETSDGYLVANPRIARTGVQMYKGFELGRPDLKDVSVYRPEAEVFHKDSIASLAHKPVTIEHPHEPVNAKNWSDHAVGHLDGNVMRDGEFVRVPLVLMDATAIDEVQSGKAQLSVGYSAILVWGDGVTPEGEPYQATQTSIRANHVAITHTARGGPKLRMGDRKQQEKKAMATRQIMIDNIPVELEERDVAVVERALNKLREDLGVANTALATAKTTAQNDVATAKTETANAVAVSQTKDAEIATLKKQLDDSKMSPQKLDAMVSDRVKTVQRAQGIIGDSVVVEGKTDADIRRQVVAAKMGETAKDWSDDMITASFNTLTVAVGDTSNGNLHQVVQVIRNSDNFNGSGDPVKKSYDEYDAALSARWKTAGVRQPV